MIPIDTRPGPFDLRFRLFGTPVRVKVSFWIFMALFGWPLTQDPQDGLANLVIWIACGFLAVMVHELGHALAGRAFGYPGVIILYAFGGGAIGEYLRAKPWQRIVIAAAGPIAGLALYVLVAFVFAPIFAKYLHQRVPGPLFWYSAIGFLIFMTLFWNLLNLPPVLPMDGGMIMKDLVLLSSPRGGLRLAYTISFVFAVLIGGYFLYEHLYGGNHLGKLVNYLIPPVVRSTPPALSPLWMVIFYAMFAFQSFQMMTERGPRGYS